MKTKITDIRFILSILFFTFTFSTYADIRVVILGSSTAADLNGILAYKWTTKYWRTLEEIDKNNQFINLAVDGFTTYHVLPNNFAGIYANKPTINKNKNISAALSYHPDVIIINLPTNDVALNCTVEDIMANFKTIIEEAKAQGVDVWITSTQGRKFSTEAQQNKLKQLKDAINFTYKDKVIDFWSDLTTKEGYLLTTFDSGDHAHMNAAGHEILYQRVIDLKIHITQDKGQRLYIAGDATNGEWEMKKSIPMKKDATNPNIYTIDCELKGNSAFKILKQPDLTGYGIEPSSGNIQLSGKSSFTERTTTEASSNKWSVPADGKYKITVNLSTKEITAQPSGTSNIIDAFDNTHITITPQGQAIQINTQDINTEVSAQVITLTGLTVAIGKSSGESFTVGNNLSSGVYIVRVNYNNNTLTQKVIIK